MTTGNGRIVGIALLVSLAVNLLLVGLLAAHLLRGSSGHRGEHAPLPGLPSMHQLSRELSEPSRDALRTILQSHRRDIREQLGASRQSRRDVAAALLADPFDAAVLQSAFAHQREQDARIAEQIQNALVEFAQTLDAEQRQSLLRAMASRHEGRDRSRSRRPRQDGSSEPAQAPAARD